MKTHILILAAALLSSCCAAPVVPAPIPGAPQEARSTREPRARFYEPAPAEAVEPLRLALAQTTRVDISRQGFHGEPVSVTLEGAELEALLAQLRRVPQWYEQRYSPSFLFHPAYRTEATFYDAEGKGCLTLRSAWTNKDRLLCYATEGGKAVCLIHLLGEYLPET